MVKLIFFIAFSAVLFGREFIFEQEFETPKSSNIEVVVTKKGDLRDINHFFDSFLERAEIYQSSCKKRSVNIDFGFGKAIFDCKYDGELERSVEFLKSLLDESSRISLNRATQSSSDYMTHIYDYLNEHERFLSQKFNTKCKGSILKTREIRQGMLVKFKFVCED